MFRLLLKTLLTRHNLNIKGMLTFIWLKFQEMTITQYKFNNEHKEI